MPPAAHLASLSNAGFISGNFFGFCEAAWPRLAVGGAQNERKRKQVETQGMGRIYLLTYFYSFQSNENALRMVSGIRYYIRFLFPWEIKFWTH